MSADERAKDSWDWGYAAGRRDALNEIRALGRGERVAPTRDASIANALARGKPGDIVTVPYDQLLALRDIVLNAFLETFEAKGRVSVADTPPEAQR